LAGKNWFAVEKAAERHGRVGAYGRYRYKRPKSADEILAVDQSRSVKWIQDLARALACFSFNPSLPLFILLL
jgi:hypothetical protein